jgi:hypothetical protein
MSRVLEKNMSGEYSKMFNLEEHESNKHFVRNAYQPGKCQCGDMVCFSLTNGALPCRPDTTKMLIYSAEGVVTAVPVKH